MRASSSRAFASNFANRRGGAAADWRLGSRARGGSGGRPVSPSSGSLPRIAAERPCRAAPPPAGARCRRPPAPRSGPARRRSACRRAWRRAAGFPRAAGRPAGRGSVLPRRGWRNWPARRRRSAAGRVRRRPHRSGRGRAAAAAGQQGQAAGGGIGDRARLDRVDLAAPAFVGQPVEISGCRPPAAGSAAQRLDRTVGQAVDEEPPGWAGPARAGRGSRSPASSWPRWVIRRRARPVTSPKGGVEQRHVFGFGLLEQEVLDAADRREILQVALAAPVRHPAAGEEAGAMDVDVPGSPA